MLDRLFQFLLPFEEYSSIAIFLILIVCGLGVPIPEDITLISGGILISYNFSNFWTILLVSTAGILCGDSVVYLLGRFLGEKIIRSNIISKLLKVKHIDTVEKALDQYGNYIVFLARFMPGLRMPVYFTVGTFKRSFLSFFLIDALAAIISVPLWIYVGMVFGQNLPLLEEYIARMQYGLYIILTAIILVIVLLHFLNKKLIGWFSKKVN